MTLREQLAALAHEQWSGWMRYLFSKCSLPGQRENYILPPGAIFDSELVIPRWAATRWQRQMETRYADLPEEEKESDRKEADRVLELFEAERELDLKAAAQVQVDAVARVRAREVDPLRAELDHIDQVLARRPALDGEPTRAAKIEKAISVAALSDKLRDDVAILLRIERVAGTFINDAALFCPDPATREVAALRYRQLWNADPKPIPKGLLSALEPLFEKGAKP